MAAARSRATARASRGRAKQGWVRSKAAAGRADRDGNGGLRAIPQALEAKRREETEAR